jgi:hypothetical protein
VISFVGSTILKAARRIRNQLNRRYPLFRSTLIVPRNYHRLSLVQLKGGGTCGKQDVRMSEGGNYTVVNQRLHGVRAGSLAALLLEIPSPN